MKNNILPSTICSSNFEKQAAENSQFSQSLNHLERLFLLKILIVIAYGKNLKQHKSWISKIRPKKFNDDQTHPPF